MIHGIPPIRPPAGIELPGVERSSAGGGFAGAMESALASVQAVQNRAHESAGRLLAGEAEDVHKVALDQQRAAIAFDLMLQVRNKVVNAYQEVMRMQI